MTDCELLELAANAAGYVIDEPARNGSSWAWVYPDGSALNEEGEHPSFKWNPLNDDGDALRLAVKLEMQICLGFRRVEAVIVGDIEGQIFQAIENKQGDILAATRRAIVRAAAEIGKEKTE
jgi:hypothetical protein